jgi:hypothetical protein
MCLSVTVGGINDTRIIKFNMLSPKIPDILIKKILKQFRESLLHMIEPLFLASHVAAIRLVHQILPRGLHQKYQTEQR